MAKAAKPKPKHIAVAGNIGAGKTTLTEMLSKHYKWIPNFEDVDHNPYLNDFYEDMSRWSFNLQIYFFFFFFRWGGIVKYLKGAILLRKKYLSHLRI